MTSEWDPEARVVLVETFRRAWADGSARIRLGEHRLTDEGVSFALLDRSAGRDRALAEVEFAWSEIVGAVLSEDRLDVLRERAAARLGCAAPSGTAEGGRRPEGGLPPPRPVPTHYLGRCRRIH